MIHRKSSFFILFILTLILTLYIYDSPWLILLIICAGTITAGLGITLLLPDLSASYRQIGLSLIACTLGIAFGVSLSVQMKLNTLKVYTGIKIQNITSFTGICFKDTVTGTDKVMTHYINLVSVKSDILSVSAGARGKVMVLSDHGVSLFRGEKVKIKAELISINFRPDIHFLCYAKPREIRVTGFPMLLFRIRRNILSGLQDHIDKMGYPASALFQALFLGVRENLPEGLYNGFEKTGTLHLLALSGLHVGIIYAFISILLFFLPGKWSRYITGFITVCFYLFLAGPKPSLLRATIMLIIFGFGYLLAYEREPLNLLSIAGSLILIANPVSAFSLSFQLSFLALAGIFIIGRPISRALRKYLPGFIALPISVSIGAQTMTAPIILINFGIIYPSGIIVTLLLIPVITVFLWAGIIILLLSYIHLPFILSFSKIILSILYQCISTITLLFVKMPGISGKWEGWYWIIFMLFLFIFIFNKNIIIRHIKEYLKKRQIGVTVL